MIGEPDNFGEQWARRKLDMPRRERELRRYIAEWLPELEFGPFGIVLDIGCGPGDFLKLCRNLGHGVFGVDAPHGRGGMGDAYQTLAAQYREEFDVPCDTSGLMRFLDGHRIGDLAGKCSLVHCRGAIEQCFAAFMAGDPHDLHHNCRRLDWKPDAGPWLDRLIHAAADLLLPNGILTIVANGTRSTDEWYSDRVTSAALSAGLTLREQRGILSHKWVKPCNETTGSKGRVAASHPISHSELATVCV